MATYIFTEEGLAFASSPVTAWQSGRMDLSAEKKDVVYLSVKATPGGILMDYIALSCTGAAKRD